MYEWAMTDKYDPSNLDHKQVKEGVEVCKYASVQMLAWSERRVEVLIILCTVLFCKYITSHELMCTLQYKIRDG